MKITLSPSATPEQLRNFMMLSKALIAWASAENLKTSATQLFKFGTEYMQPATIAYRGLVVKKATVSTIGSGKQFTLKPRPYSSWSADKAAVQAFLKHRTDELDGIGSIIIKARVGPAFDVNKFLLSCAKLWKERELLPKDVKRALIELRGTATKFALLAEKELIVKGTGVPGNVVTPKMVVEMYKPTRTN